MARASRPTSWGKFSAVTSCPEQGVPASIRAASKMASSPSTRPRSAPAARICSANDWAESAVPIRVRPGRPVGASRTIRTAHAPIRAELWARSFGSGSRGAEPADQFLDLRARQVELEGLGTHVVDRDVVEDAVFPQVRSECLQGAGIAPEQNPVFAGEQSDETERLALEAGHERFLPLVDGQPLHVVGRQVMKKLGAVGPRNLKPDAARAVEAERPRSPRRDKRFRAGSWGRGSLW